MKSRVGENNPMYGKKHSEESKKQMSISHRRNALTDASERQLRKIINQVIKEIQNESIKNKPRSIKEPCSPSANE